MNLHALAAPSVGVVNPLITVTVKRSTGYLIGADGRQIPTYQVFDRQAQVQALSGSEIKRLNDLGIQDVMKSAFLTGKWEGIVRKDGKGGDLFLFGGNTWLVVHVMENWPDWSRVALALQTDGRQ